MLSQLEISSGAIQATINAKDKMGWCGLRQLHHPKYAKDWLLAPALTLEHYLGMSFDAPDYIDYEPCASPKHLEAVSSEAGILHYEPLACSKLSCRLSYRAVAPHYVDVLATVQTQRENWPFNYMALFFATIVKAPVYTGINFLGQDLQRPAKGDNRWIHFNGLAAQPGRVIHPAGHPQPELPRPDNPPDTYYYDDSSVRFESPFFYAQLETMTFMVMFRPSDKDNIRFVVNPVAPAFGGPAWDFFWIIESPSPEQTYTLPFRTMFKPFVSTADILEEYEVFSGSIVRE